MKSIVPKLMLAAILLLSAGGCNRDDDSNNTIATPNLRLVADNLVSPLGVTEANDGSKRLFIIDQVGKIWIVKPDGTMPATPFIDISSKMVSLSPQYDERGLLGLAFHPDYATNGKFYLFYTAPPAPGGPEPGVAWNSLTRISEFRVSSTNPDLADMSSERVLLEDNHPQMNHNGGTIAFGPDGYLYFSIGDGGGSNDNAPGHVNDWYATNAGGNAQNVYANLMGKVSRIDVNSGNPYSIPPDNPFAGTTAKPEIYAFGFRNPYRFSFDMGGSHQLVLGDAGQSLWEEINLVTKGGNYGWNVKEGSVCFNADTSTVVRPNCPSTDSMGNPLIEPVVQLKNASHPDGDGIASVIVGGNVYRGTALPSWRGKYIFGTFSHQATDGELFMATPAGSGPWSYSKVSLKDYPDNLGMYIKGFGQDLSGEIYVTTSMNAGVSGTTGKVYKIVAANP